MCGELLSSIEVYIEHLLCAHDSPASKHNLIRLGLGECPYCHKRFAASRGWSKHTQICKSDSDLTLGEWPRPCWVWWKADQKFYKGVATSVEPTRPPTYMVTYDKDKDEERELEQFVVFTDPEPKPSYELESTTIVETPQYDETELEEGEVPHECEEKTPRTLDDLLPDWFQSKSCLPDRVTTNKSELSGLLVDLNRVSSVLRRLPPLRLWRGNQRRLWARCTRQFVPYFEASMKTESTSESFLKLCLRLLELPSIILSPDIKNLYWVSSGYVL